MLFIIVEYNYIVLKNTIVSQENKQMCHRTNDSNLFKNKWPDSNYYILDTLCEDTSPLRSP